MWEKVCYNYRLSSNSTEAVHGVVNWAFSIRHLTKLTADCLYQTNHASVRVLEKSGFQRLHHDGELLYWELHNNEMK